VTATLLHVDAFTAEPFRGNPAAVCLLPSARDAAWMQALATELGLPATAFVVRAGGDRALRWFTPSVELELCGHGTLAAAHALWEMGNAAADDAVTFSTRSGPLRAVRRDRWIEMDFPAEAPAATPPADGLLAALGAAARWTGRNRLDWIVELEDEAAVRALAPDLVALARVQTRGVIVTARAATPGYDFVSRFFAPRMGLPEDAVTGSAHCALGPLWGARLGRPELVGLQVSARGGVVRVTPAGERVRLAGQAVTVFSGTLR
jgi:PhzF family phenazine biosynthesis protein